MKFELGINITQADVEAVVDEYIRQTVRAAVAERCRLWGTEREIKALVGKAFPDALGKVIADELQDVDRLREEVRGVISRKLQAQITKAMKQGAHDA